jgi:TPP-dependent pyruvate/acetoin dehydrogenase alpha subunit
MPRKPKKKTEEFSLIPREKLLNLYASLVRCNMLERFIAENAPIRRSATRTSAAAAVAACTDRLLGDAFAAPARDFLPAFVEGKSLSLVLSGLSASTAVQRSGFAAQVRAVLAEARRNNGRGKRRIVIIFGRPATGRLWQSLLKTATAERLPIIFVCKGQSHRRSLRPVRHLPAIAVDRDDVVAIYRVASEGIAHARRGNGPTLIECFPWRGDGTNANAIAKMEAHLAEKGISADRRIARVKAKFESELASRKSPQKVNA